MSTLDAIDMAALEAWMDERGLGAGPIHGAAPLTGGTQNIMIRFRRAERGFVLRRPPRHPRAESNRVMQREGTVLRALAGSAVPHPGFIAGCWDAAPLGTYFFLMESVDGFNIHAGLSATLLDNPAARARMGFAYIEALAALGRVDHRAVGLDGFGTPDGFLERQAGRWIGQIERYAAVPQWTGHAELGDVEAIAAWLDANVPATYAPGILHGDCHLANVMFDERTGDVAALIDWEMATIGDPRLDLGWVVATWPDDPDLQLFALDTWRDKPALDSLIRHYAERSERDMSELDWFSVLACFKLGAILEGTHARAQAGKAPLDTGRTLHGFTIALFNKARRIAGI